MVYISKCTRHGASYVVALPRDVREALKVQPGDVIGMRIQQDHVVLRRLPVEAWVGVRGLDPIGAKQELAAEAPRG